MEQKNLEGLTKEQMQHVGMMLRWVSGKVEAMTNTLQELHRDNQEFLKESYRKQQLINRQLYELRGRDPQTYRP